jgi:hypothetical protein
VKIDHQPGGVTIADTQVIAALFARPAAAVRRHCPRHALGYDVATCEAILAEAPDLILVTARQAQQYLAIAAGTVRSWACRGAIRSYDHTAEGWPLYDVGELLALKESEQRACSTWAGSRPPFSVAPVVA